MYCEMKKKPSETDTVEVTDLPIWALNSLLCSVHLSLSPWSPLISAAAAVIFLRQVSASSRRVCNQMRTTYRYVTCH